MSSEHSGQCWVPKLVNTLIIYVEVPSWAETPFTEKELQTITYIVPVKDIR